MSAGDNPRGRLQLLHVEQPLVHEQLWGLGIGWTTPDGQANYVDQEMFRRGACPVEVAESLRRLADRINPPRRLDATPLLSEASP